MRDVDPEVQAMFAKMVHQLEEGSLKQEREAAEANPRKHRLSRVIAGRGGMNYHWFGGARNRKGQAVYFCWAIHRNVAGYFLTWRQIRQKDGVVKRDRWAARKTRKGAAAMARRRWHIFSGL